MTAVASYHHGTHRTVSPAETLAWIAPLAGRCGITRCTSVTQLDGLHIPTYCAIRPDALTLQVSNGKGLTDTAARVSALMEAVELHHAEHPRAGCLRRACVNDLRAEGARLIWPPDIPGFYGGYFSERFQCDWVEGVDLVDGRAVWAPASAIYFCQTPGLYDTSSNGLASGNHLAEATLHALYEVVERDARARLSVGGSLRIDGRALNVDTRTVTAPELQALIAHIAADDTKVLLLWIRGVVPLHTFMAVLLNTKGLVATSRVNVGAGTHADQRVAAARALTEAAQSRLTFIHGARDDLLAKIERNGGGPAAAAFRFFDGLDANATWDRLGNESMLRADWDLELHLQRLVAALAHAGHRTVARFDLTHPDIGVPVVKVVVPGLRSTLSPVRRERRTDELA